MDDGARSSIESRYDQLSKEFFDVYYTYHPSHATRQGLHQYDDHLGNYRRDDIEETLRRMKAIRRGEEARPRRGDRPERCASVSRIAAASFRTGTIIEMTGVAAISTC